MSHVTYPRIRDLFVDRSLVLTVQWREDAAPVHYCGETWCTGGCGLPALVVPQPNQLGCELKARSSMAAHGPVMQPWGPKNWTGERAEVPEEHRDFIMKAYWR